MRWLPIAVLLCAACDLLTPETLDTAVNLAEDGKKIAEEYERTGEIPIPLVAEAGGTLIDGLNVWLVSIGYDGLPFSGDDAVDPLTEFLQHMLDGSVPTPPGGT